jgi:hypothetical protein
MLPTYRKCIYDQAKSLYTYAQLLIHIWRSFLEKDAILISYFKYGICIVSIDFVDLTYMGIDTNIAMFCRK